MPSAKGAAEYPTFLPAKSAPCLGGQPLPGKQAFQATHLAGAWHHFRVESNPQPEKTLKKPERAIECAGTTGKEERFARALTERLMKLQQVQSLANTDVSQKADGDIQEAVQPRNEAVSMELLVEQLHKVKQAWRDVLNLNANIHQFLKDSVGANLSRMHSDVKQFDTFRADIQQLYHLLSNEEIPGVEWPSLCMEGIAGEHYWINLSMLFEMSQSWVGKHLSEYLEGIKTTMNNLSATVLPMRIQCTSVSQMIINLQFQYPEEEVFHVLLPMDFLSTDGGERQLKMELFLRFGCDIMTKMCWSEIMDSVADIAYLNITYQLDIPKIKDDTVPRVALSFDLCTTYQGKNYDFQVIMMNPEDLFFLSWPDPDVKGGRWIECFIGMDEMLRGHLTEMIKKDDFSGKTVQLNYLFRYGDYDAFNECDHLKKDRMKRGFRSNFLQAMKVILDKKD